MMMENRMMTGNRVDCLYRVSTDKQVDYNDKSQADIPMQRRECHRFCEKMGWTIVHEEQEDGVSGHKVSAETLMHILVKDDPYHSVLGLIDSQLKNFELAFIEAPALYMVIPIRSKTALETAVLDELAESGFGCFGG